MSNDNIFEQYITCRENCSLLYLEALAMNGFVKKAYSSDCEKTNFKKLTVVLENDIEITSSCRYFEEINQSLRIINIYVGLKKKLRNKSN